MHHIYVFGILGMSTQINAITGFPSHLLCLQCLRTLLKG